MKIQGPRPAVTPSTSAPAAAARPAETGAPAPTGWAAKAPSTSAAQAAAATSEQETRTRAAAESFFRSFGARDLKAVEAAYSPNAHFKDDMFTLTRRDSVMKMWTKSPAFKTFDAQVLEVKGNTVKARWSCDYEMFGKPVHNEIESTLTFDAQGRITNQQEHWNTEKWMSQALPIVPKFAQGAVYAVLRPLLSWQLGG